MEKKLDDKKLDNKGRFFPIALLDMQMPGMDGAQLGKRIREDERFDQTKLVMMTSMSDRGDAKSLKDIGFSAYFPKPTTTEDLFGALSVLLDEHDTQSSASPLVTHHFLEGLKRNAKHQEVHEYLENQSWPSKTRILLVEDNFINQTVAKSVLGEFGLICDSAEHGVEALQMLRAAPDSSPYTLILMDCQMPELDGYAATRKIREGEAGQRYQDTTIIAMTANAMQGDREKCLDAGMNDYLTKPLDNEDLLQKLFHWLVSQNTESEPYLDANESTEAEEKASRSEEYPVWDYHAFSKRMMGKQIIIDKTVGILLGDLPRQIEEIKQSVQSDDLDKIRNTAHALKGSASNVSAIHVSEIARKMEAYAMSDELAEAKSLLPELEVAVSELIQMLKTFTDKSA
jgi:CheY-like chemotaxis protein/HPt (histidine-containing phosphotransfer) domain-containing protein